MPDLLIRMATDADVNAIYAVHMSSVRALCAADYDSAQIESWLAGRSQSMYLDAIRAESLWVAVSAESMLIVGFVEVAGHELTKLFVAGSSARKGVGKRLLLHALAAMKQQGVVEAYLEATLTAVPFYEYYGFVAGSSSFFSHGNSPVLLKVVNMLKVL